MRRAGSALATTTLLAALAASTASAAPKTYAPPTYDEALYPPWSHGKNNPATNRGLEFTVPEVDVMADFHGSIDGAKLVLFVGGNYFFAMAPLAEEFQREHPDYRGRLFYVTIPPGLLVRAMRNGGTFTSGNMTFAIRPDVYAAGRKKVDELVTGGLLRGPAISYATNDLTIMIPKGNPGHIRSLRDLGRPGLTIVMPNPQFEGVTRQIESSLRKVGGTALATAVYDTKVKNGETILTHIHHRQAPLFLMEGLGDAGVTWRSEAIFQEQAGHPLSHVAIPDADNSTAIYGAALVRTATHPEAGKLWLRFLRSSAALKIFERYGFKSIART